MVTHMPINTVDGRVRLSWHHYTHLTHKHTRLSLLQNLIAKHHQQYARMSWCQTSCHVDPKPTDRSTDYAESIASRGKTLNRSILLHAVSPIFALSNPSFSFSLLSPAPLHSPLVIIARFPFSILNLSSLD